MAKPTDKFKSRSKKVSDDFDEDRTYVRKTVKRPDGKADPMKWHGQEYYGPDGKVMGRSLDKQDVKELDTWFKAPKSAPAKSRAQQGPYKNRLGKTELPFKSQFENRISKRRSK